MTKPDQPYTEAGIEAVGRNVAVLFLAMLENGMERAEALEVVKAWIQAVIASGSQEPKR